MYQVKALAGAGDLALPFNMRRNPYDVQSEAGVRAGLNELLSEIAFAVRALGTGCKWVFEATSATAARSRAASKAAVSPPAKAAGKKRNKWGLLVRGLLGKKPDFELFDSAGVSVSFVEAKLP